MKSRGQAAFGFTVAAFAYGVALTVWVLAVPSIDGETLLSHSGLLSLAVAVQPLLASSLLFVLLRRRCTTGSVPATIGAWTFGSLFFAWSVIAGFSLAAWALPAALLLLIAVGLTPRPAASLA